MKGKIFWFINDYSGSKYHGMEFRNYNIAKELVKLGHKVVIVSASYSHLFKVLPLTKGEYTHEDVDGIDFLWIKVPKYKSSSSPARILKWFIFVKKLYSIPVNTLPKPDYIIASPMAPFLIMPSHHYAKKYGAKLIYDVKDIWPLSLMELGGYSRWHPFIMLMQWFTNYALKKSHLTTSSLSNAFEYMEQHGLIRSKFKYIPNGISLEEMSQPAPLDKDVADHIPKEKFIIGYTGTIGIANAMAPFLQAASFLKEYTDIMFIIIGSGDEKQTLNNLKRELKLSNVFLYDPVPKNQVQSALAEFDVCFLATQNKELYNYGVSLNKLYDYMFASKPMVYAINDKNSVIERAKCGIQVNSDNPREIADTILKFYKMPISKRIEMGENGRKYVLQHHTYDQIAKEFINTLEDLN